jgi:outer membrane receptor protein involved in Fe transport
MKLLRPVLLMPCLVLLLSGPLWAGTTGKIAGRIMDQKTKDPLAGANVVLLGTDRGAISDQQGYYHLVNVPVGTYSLKVSMMGYLAVTKSEVRVSADLTARVDFSLEETLLRIPGEVRVTAERPLIQRDQTATERVFMPQELQRLPGSEEVAKALSIQPNVVRDVELDELHLRGGRGGEILYSVDGLPINDPFVGGVERAAVPISEIAEMELMTGGFSAEFGQAQSGVVNVVTRDGTPEASGELLFKTDDFGGGGGQGTNYDHAYVLISGPEPVSSYVLPSLGWNPPGDLRFLVSGSLSLEDTYAPTGEARPRHRRFGIDLRDRQENAYGLNAKLTYLLTPGSKLNTSYRDEHRWYDRYRHQWMKIPNHTYQFDQRTTSRSLSFNQTVSRDAYFAVNLGRFETSLHYDTEKTPEELRALQDSFEYALTHGLPIPEDRGEPWDKDRDGFYEAGYDSLWHDHRLTRWTGKIDGTWQFERHHQFRSGAEGNLFDLQKTQIEFPYFYDGQRAAQESGPWAGYGLFRESYRVYPSSGALYFQDKLETEGMMANLGLRYDFFFVGNQVHDSLVSNRVKQSFSPRLGLSYPWTDRDVLFFTYGHFYQMPEFQYIYRSREVRLGTPLIGNPDLKPERTISYEIRLEHLFSDEIVGSVSGYAKDIRNLIDAQKRGRFPFFYYEYTNSSYGDVRGIELSLKRRYSDHYSFEVSYVLSKAEGSASYDEENYRNFLRGDTTVFGTHPLNWDQRHALNLLLELRSEDTSRERLLRQWEGTVLYRYGSGLPYTIQSELEKQGSIARNSARLPAWSAIDVKITRNLHLGGLVGSLFLEVENFLASKNQQKPFSSPSYPPDPTLHGPGRRVVVGLRASW